MKKTLLALLGFILLSPLMVTAQVIFQYGDFTCSAGRNAITIIRYTGLGGAVTIPASIGGLPVTVIGSQAFADKTSLISVTIPTSVTEILDEAFANCTSLTSVGIPGSVTIIATPFVFCSRMVAITVDPANTSYSSLDGVLFNKNQTTLIEYPGGKVGDYAIPGNVTSIGYKAFYFCVGLTSVTISGSVTSIGGSAFVNCTGLTSLTVPASASYIADFAFAGCTRLTAINVDPDNASYSSLDGVLLDKSQTALIEYPGGKVGSYAIPSSVTRIVHSAFEDCSGLTNVMVPGSVTNIESDAFFGCTGLQPVFFKGNAPGLGLDVFSTDTNATVYYLPGATGWSPTFSGRPAVLWNPLIQNSGVGPAGFGFNITGTPDIPIVVEAATSLAHAAWIPLQSLNLTNGTLYFSDPNWTDYPARFYRIRSP